MIGLGSDKKKTHIIEVRFSEHPPTSQVWTSRHLLGLAGYQAHSDWRGGRWEFDSDQTFGLDWYLFESRQASLHLRLSWTKFVTWTRWPGKEKNRKDSSVHLSANDVVVWFDPILALCRFLFSPPQDYWEGVAGCRKFQKSEVAHAIYFCVWYRMIKYLWPFETHKHIWLILRCWGKSSILCQQNSDAL